MNRPLNALRRIHELETNLEGTEPAPGEIQRLEEGLEPRLVARYRQARARHGESALSESNDNVCSGCYVRQPIVPKRLAQDICMCENCGRILYDPDAELDYLLRS